MPEDDHDSEYGLSVAKEVREIEPPAIDYLPPAPQHYRPRIGLIGTGGISEMHLRAYQACGWDVVGMTSRTLAKAESRRDEFFPEAKVYTDSQALLSDPDIDVVDITPHPQERLPILEAAIDAGKHILSQKPFVLDPAEGVRLAEKAERKGVKLAVNQNGRWAPHFAYIRQAIDTGLIGEVTSVDFVLQWDQTWVAGNPDFEKIHHLILFDFAIHWFDIASCFMGDRRAESVYACATKFGAQSFGPPALASAIIEYPGAQVRMAFHAHTQLGEEDCTTVVGTEGTLRSRGPGLNEQPEMELYLPDGQARVPLQGCWFESGFQGAMGELLCAIEEDREPYHSAANNLRSLELCLAAIESADSGEVKRL